MHSAFELPTDDPILVTGATGYVAGWIVKELLDHGATVHATVRDPNNTRKVEHLTHLANQAPGTLRLFRSDLLEPGSYADAMAGCATVFHTASPFILKVEDPQRDLVDPAVRGTQNVLQEASKTESVSRVVVTSSCVAVFGDNTDVRNTKNKMFTEDDWNTTSSLTHNPYAYSKTMAERAAWDLADRQNQWTMVTINPHFVLGPGITPQSSSHSFTVLTQLGDGTLRSGVPDFCMAMVDVRDVAEMHLRAAFKPDATGRYLTFAQSVTLYQIVKILKEHFGDRYPFPKRKLPKALAWLLGPMVDSSLTRKVISQNVGVEWKGDNRKGVQDLGMQYRPIEETIREMFEQLISSGQV